MKKVEETLRDMGSREGDGVGVCVAIKGQSRRVYIEEMMERSH